MSTVMKSDVVGSEIDAPRFETRSSEDSRASRTVDKLESKLKEQLKNFDARNIDVIDPNLDDRFQTEVKLYDTDGSLDLSKVVDRSKQFKTTITALLSSVEKDTIGDNEAARVARIQSFKQLSANLVPDLTKCTDVRSVLSPGDELLVNLKCKEITNFPGSTMSSHVNGIVNVALVKNARGQVKIHFAVAEGKYEFRSTETFTQNFSSAAVSCCCCLTFGESFASSTQAMYYQTHNNFLSQDFVLPVEDCVIDSICYRKGENKVIAASGAAALNAASKDVCSACINCWASFTKCLWDQFACCLKTYLSCQLCLLTGNCAYLVPCVEALRLRYLCCSPRCLSDIFWKYLLCYSRDFKSYNKAIAFDVSDEFIMGNSNEPRKFPAEKKKEEEKAVKKEVETPWNVCPWFTCWCCYEYQGKDICPDFSTCIKLTCDLCCCKTSGLEIKEVEAEKFKWMIEKEAKDEVIVLVHYRSLLDRKVRTCSIKLDVAQENYNGAHADARKFVKLIADYRYPLVNNVHEFKDYPPASSAGARANPFPISNMEIEAAAAKASNALALVAGAASAAGAVGAFVPPMTSSESVKKASKDAGVFVDAVKGSVKMIAPAIRAVKGAIREIEGEINSL